jgi:hypothetical protein
LLHLQLPQQVLAKRFTGFVRKFADRPAFAVPAAVLDAPVGARLPLVLGPDRLDLGRGLVARLGNVRQVATGEWPAAIAASW